MTRAAYTLAQMYPDIQTFLLDSDEKLIVETSLYDHYWGIGRDLRGDNMAGRVWMDVRERFKAKSKESAL